MKFGKYIQKNQVPEWSRYYLPYKKLKRVIKQIDKKNGNESDIKDSDGIKEFENGLEIELNKIESFYKNKLEEYTKRINSIDGQYKSQSLAPLITKIALLPSQSTYPNEIIISDSSEIESKIENFGPHIELTQLIHQQKSLLTALLVIKFQLFQLIQFREMNFNGIVKILKKADKRLNSSIMEDFLIKKEKEMILFDASKVQKLHQDVTELTDLIQKDLQKTLTFLDPSTNDFASYGSVIIEKHQILVTGLLNDDVECIVPFLNAITKANSDDKTSVNFYKSIEIVLELACYYGAVGCCLYLIKSYDWLIEMRDLDERSIFHKLAIFGLYGGPDEKDIASSDPSIPIISTALDSPSEYYKSAKNLPKSSYFDSDLYSPLKLDMNDILPFVNGNHSEYSTLAGKDSSKVFDAIINYILEFCPDLILKVMDMDIFGRRPLHYAALKNFPLLYNSMVKVINRVESLELSEWWYDLDGNSPLFYAILKGHCEVLMTILEDFPKCLNITLTTSELGIQNPLKLAATLSYSEVLKILINAGANLFTVDEAGESALHVLARNGNLECTEVLLEGAKENAVHLINLKDHESESTALILAATEGHREICNLFIAYGADLSIEDKHSWRAYEHAIFHGYIELAKTLKGKFQDNLDLLSKYLDEKNNHSKKSKSKAYRASLSGTCAAVLTLGKNDIRTYIDPIVFFEECNLFTELKNLKLIISVTSSIKPLAVINLPVRDEEPIVLNFQNLTNPQLTFDIVPRFGSTTNELLARGSWQLTTSNNSSTECISVALISAKNMNVVGHINFQCVIVTPFIPPSFNPSQSTFSRQNADVKGSTRLIGHRGLGANQKVKGESQLQIGENTVLSFITAASLGAEYVEFDVQLTKDKVPVIYHDWTVTESGYDLPINAFTLKQFLKIYEKVYKLSNRPDPKERLNNFNRTQELKDELGPLPLTKRMSTPSIANRNRSKSLDIRGLGVIENKQKYDHKATEEQNEHVLLRVKGNNVDTIQAPFTTLAETFKQVPRNIGFNIEIKYPMIDEAEEADIRGSEIELNTFVDCILKVVYSHLTQENTRPVMFSSFHPEICLLLALKQNHFPVFFLSDCGYTAMADPRCNSLKEAVKFSTAHGLDGVVIVCDPLIEAPRLISSVKDAGLKCFTYGSRNNEPTSVTLQKQVGVDAVIVDSVAAISRSLLSDGGKDGHILTDNICEI